MFIKLKIHWECLVRTKMWLAISNVIRKFKYVLNMFINNLHLIVAYRRLDCDIWYIWESQKWWSCLGTSSLLARWHYINWTLVGRLPFGDLLRNTLDSCILPATSRQRKFHCHMEVEKLSLGLSSCAHFFEKQCGNPFEPRLFSISAQTFILIGYCVWLYLIQCGISVFKYRQIRLYTVHHLR